MSKQLVVTLLGGLPLGFRLSALKEDERFYAVSKIRQHSKAEKSGLQLGDVILCVNGINCEGLSHVAVTALTDISDILNLLVLRNAKSSKDVVDAFASLGPSVRRLTSSEISDLTGNQNSLTVTRRQSTGCILQGLLPDQHKQNPVKLFGSHKIRQNNFTTFANFSQKEDMKSDSEERKFEETTRISERRRERHHNTINGAQKRHLVPSRLKNIVQNEVLEKELEEELRREMNLQKFEETAKESLTQIQEPVKDPFAHRGVRCASEEPRYKTNMQFKLSTDEIKKNQKPPTIQTKVSIRRFSLAVPNEAASSSSEQASDANLPRNKLNIVPSSLKPLSSSPRRAQFSVRSNSIQDIQPMQEPGKGLLMKNDLNAHVSPSSVENSMAMRGDGSQTTKPVDSNRVRISSSSVKTQIMPPTRLRSNSLSVLSTGRTPPSSKFERPTNFSLSTGSKVAPTVTKFQRNAENEVVDDRKTFRAQQNDFETSTNEASVENIIEAPAEFQDSPIESTNSVGANQNSKERRPSFSSQSRALNPLPMVKMPSNVIKIKNKPIAAISSPVSPSIKETALSNVPSYNAFVTPKSTFRANYTQRESHETKPTSQPVANPTNYWTSDYTRKSETTERLYGHDLLRSVDNATRYPPPPVQLQSNHSLPVQPSSNFQQTGAFARARGPSGFSTFPQTPPPPFSNAPSSYSTQKCQPPNFNSYHHQSWTASSSPSSSSLSSKYSPSASQDGPQDRQYTPGTSYLGQHPSNRQLSSNFSTSPIAQPWHVQSAKDRADSYSFSSPVHSDNGMRYSRFVSNAAQSAYGSQDRSHPIQNLIQPGNYATLPRNFKSAGSAPYNTGSFFTNSNQNIWQPSSKRTNLADVKHWDQAKTN